MQDGKILSFRLREQQASEVDRLARQAGLRRAAWLRFVVEQSLQMQGQKNTIEGTRHEQKQRQNSVRS